MSLWGWRSVFYSLFLPGLIVAALFWTFVPNRPSESKRASAEELAEMSADDAPDSLKGGGEVRLVALLKDRNIQKFFWAYFTFALAIWGFTAWLPTYLVKARGFSMVQMGVFSSLPFLAGTAGSILGGWVSDRIFSNNRRLPIVISGLASALFLSIMLSSDSVYLLAACQVLTGFFLLFFVTSFWALPMNAVPKEVMGAASGFINMAGQIAGFIAPLVLGYLVDETGGDYNLAFLFLVSSLLISSGIIWMIPFEPLPRQEEVAPG
jgi:sugar phosphate permease